MNLVRRLAIVALAAVVVIGLGAAAYAFVPWRDKGSSDTAGAAGAPKEVVTGNGRFELFRYPPPGATDIAPETSINVTALNGKLTRLSVKAPDGTPVQGYLDQDGQWWLAKASLAPGTEYHVDSFVVPNHGKAHREQWTFTTVAPTAGLGARVVPGDNEVVGVGQPITVRFTAPVANRANVEERLKVTTSVPVTGSWHWINDREVHWRPADYWPAHTQVSLDANLNGVDAGNGIFGNVYRTVHFSIGDSHVSIADAASHTLSVYENGALVKSFPLSAGRDKYPTMSGKHIVLGKAADVIMDSATNGIPRNSPDGYYEHVAWDTQISSTGEYVHAAPWSVSDQGNSNVSHGCINISTANAQWFFNWSQRGDIVEVTGTSRPPNDDIAMIDWKLPFSEWQAGSALFDPIPAPQALRA